MKLKLLYFIYCYVYEYIWAGPVTKKKIKTYHFQNCYSFNNRVLSFNLITINIFLANLYPNSLNVACRIIYRRVIFSGFHWIPVSASMHIFDVVFLLFLLFLQEQEYYFLLVYLTAQVTKY